MITLSGLVPLLIQLVIGGCVFYVLWWLLGKIAPPEPINKICVVVLALICAVWLLNLLLPLMGGQAFIRW